MLPGERAAGSAYSFGVAKNDVPQPRPHSSGFRTFLNWFKRVEVSRRVPERPQTPEVDSDDGDSSGSETSTATASSFAFLPPAGYRPYGDALTPHKFIASGPYTETYRHRVAERERRRRLDNGVTLRKKYNLHGADATLSPLRETHSPDPEPKDYDTFSLPAMSKRPAVVAPEHRRAASESKFVRPTSYVHVKGKRRAPPPPTTDGVAKTAPLSATLTRRVKRLAPKPPTKTQSPPSTTEVSPSTTTPSSLTKALPLMTENPPLTTQAPLLTTKAPPLTTQVQPTDPWMPTSTPSSPKPLRLSQLFSKKEPPLSSTAESISPVIQKSSVSDVLTSAVVTCEVQTIPALVEPTAPPLTFSEELVEQLKVGQVPVVKSDTSSSMCDQNLNPKKPILLHSKSEESWKAPGTVKENGELSPRPWYKRQFSENKIKTKTHSEDHKIRGKPELPDISFFRYSKIFESKKNSTSPKNENKRFSGPHALPNISELDREAAEILQMHKKSSLEENNNEGNNSETQNFANPRSARLLITKFNELNKGKVSDGVKGRNESIIYQNKISPSAESNEFTAQLKSIPEEGKLKSGDDTWVCMRCEKRNNCKKIICSSCFSRKPRDEDLFSKDIKENLFQSFESEVLDGLAHLRNMGVPENENTKNMEKSNETNFTKESVVAVDKNEETHQLRQILREMKNSLPKTTKNTNDMIVSNSSNTNAPMAPSTSSVEGVKLEKKTVLVTEQNSTKVNDSKQKSSCPNKTSDILSKLELKIQTNVNIKKDEPHIIKNNTSNVITSPKILTNNCTSTEANKSNETRKIENSLYANVNVSITNSSTPSTSTEVKNPKMLLKELEAAISKGDDKSAAEIAKKLAQMKVNCTVLSSMATLVPRHSDDDVTVEVYIEDAESAAGPVRLRVSRGVTLPQLREAVQHQLDIPVPLQRWIVGKQLCVDDAPLASYNGGDFTQPLFLYLVAQAKAEVEIKTEPKESPQSTITGKAENSTKKTKDNEIMTNPGPNSYGTTIMTSSTPTSSRTTIATSSVPDTSLTVASTSSASTSVMANISTSLSSSSDSTKSEANTTKAETSSGEHYRQLVQLENQELISNTEVFGCAVCLEDCALGAGVVLRECLHTFCRQCLADTVRHCETAQVLCPYRDNQYSCDCALQEREVRALVSVAEYEKHLAKSVQLAESNMRGTFHCKTADCKGWCVYENTVNIFRCPICRRTNCLTCQVIHEGENCAEYQDRIKREAEGSGSNRAAAERTKRMLEEMCAKGDALVCPSCQVVLMKKWGCDWVRCSMCKTEICWVTRGARWGPGGKGDTSAGCRCGLDGVKCHPSCNYCH